MHHAGGMSGGALLGIIASVVTIAAAFVGMFGSGAATAEKRSEIARDDPSALPTFNPANGLPMPQGRNGLDISGKPWGQR